MSKRMRFAFYCLNTPECQNTFPKMIHCDRDIVFFLPFDSLKMGTTPIMTAVVKYSWTQCVINIVILFKKSDFDSYFKAAPFVTVDPGEDARVGRRGGAPRHSMSPVLGQAMLRSRRLKKGPPKKEEKGIFKQQQRQH